MLKSSVLVTVLMMLLCLVSTLIMSVQSQAGQAPTNLMVRQVGIDRVRVSWTPPPNPPKDGYRITTTTDFGTGIEVASTASSHEVAQQPGTTANYHLITLYMTSAVVGPVRFTVRNFTTPINITSSSLTSTSVTISWTQPPFSLPMDEYRVELRRVTDASLFCTMVEDNKSRMTSGISTVNFTNLQEFSIYNVTINVTLPSGFTATLTPTVEFTTKAAAPTAPPRCINILSITSRSVSVSWTQITCIERNGPITNYTVEFHEMGGGLIPGVVMNRTFITSGLTPYTNYTFRVAGVNDNGTGPFTNVTSILTEEETPGLVSNLAGTPKFTSIVLTWSPPQEPNGVIISYEVTYTINGNNAVRVNTSDLSTTTFTIPSLTPQTRVSDITVTAYTRIGQGEPANLPDQTTLELPVVKNVMVEMLSNTSVNVSWESINTSELTISYSRVYYYYNHSGNMDVFIHASSNSIVIDNLTSNVEYMFYVVVIAEVDGQTFTGQRSVTVMTGAVSTESSTSAISTSLPPAGSSHVGVIVGVIVLIISIAIVTVLAIFLGFWFKRRHAGKPDKSIAVVGYTKPKPNIVTILEHTSGPEIEDFPVDRDLVEGEGASFKVAVKGDPEPKLTWYHEGNELISDYSLEIQPDGTLEIASAELRHNGVYKLSARNSSGVAERELSLTVQQEGEERIAPSKENIEVDFTAVPVAEFGDYVAKNHSQSDAGFRKLYESLDSGDEHPKTVGLCKENKKLNRFANITVYDHNHITLNALPEYEDCQREFINACYVDGYSQLKRFITTQGPKDRTLVDFWRLVWQERPLTIVMVTNIKEGNKVKCQQYWPDSGSKHFGHFKVTLVEYQVFADYVIRTLQVTLEGSSASRPWKLKQFHFTSWPDHGVPEYATSMLSFHRRILSQHRSSKGPMIVHCSAGVGRTGTFICIDNVLEQIKKENKVDIAGTINKLRHQRMKMVQTPEQYIFIHDAILESVMCGDTEINSSNLRAALNKLNKQSGRDQTTNMATQFKVLDLVSPKQSDTICTAALQHPDKNRSMEFLPSDKHRVILSGEYPDYIHAVAANAYKQKKAYIIAEGPMSSTVRNMWKVICDRKCGAVIMLSDLIENGMESSCQYWPVEGQVAQFGEFIVELISQEDLSGFTIRTLEIQQSKANKAHHVTQFHITCWRPDGVCSNLKCVVDVVEELSKIQRKTGNKPVFIHCSDTVTRSGMFCAIATIIDRCKTEGVVDVFQVVKALRVQKPGAVPTLENYKALFDATLSFLDSFDTYANFQNI